MRLETSPLPTSPTIFMLSPPPSIQVFAKVASFLSLLNTWIFFSSRPCSQQSVLLYLWPGSELPMWTLYLSSPQLHPVWHPTESVAASVSLSTCQGPVILGETDSDITVTNRRPPPAASTLSHAQLVAAALWMT